MSVNPLFYKEIVPLNKEVHGHLSLQVATHYNHTAETNSIYITAVEIIKAAHEFLIVFATGDDGAIFPAALLGIRDCENLYLNKKGEWLANYMPAYVRRYPFILAATEDRAGQFTVCIDKHYAGFNDDDKGVRLFDDEGNESELLTENFKLLKEYQNHIQLTVSFCQAIKEMELLEPMKADAKLADGQELSLGGFMGVSRSKLKALKSDDIMRLFKSDYLELIYAHLASLNNVEILLKRLNDPHS